MLVKLGECEKGFCGKIVKISADNQELEKKLIEQGFVENSIVTIMYIGLFNDPLAVRINTTLIGIRRREANNILCSVYTQ